VVDDASNLGSYGSGTWETVGVIDSQYELEGGDGSNSAYLAKPHRFG
jgi:hypothetical protein